MKKITLKNGFHKATIIPKSFSTILDPMDKFVYEIVLTKQQFNRADRKLCGMNCDLLGETTDGCYVLRVTI